MYKTALAPTDECPACDLECVEYPKFYCGQILTEQDLQAIVDWTQDKFRLRRYRDGWGVVCGLEVSLATAPTGKPHLHVSPGYAVSCCGSDIVPCEPLCVDVAKICEASQNPTRRPTGIEHEALGLWSPQSGLTEDYEELTTNLRAVDLFIEPYPKELDQRIAYRRNGTCGKQPVCEYTRVRESGKLVYEPVPDLSKSPSDRLIDCWSTEYAQCSHVIDRFKAQKEVEGFAWDNPFEFKPEGDRLAIGRAIQCALLRTVAEVAIYQFAFIREWIIRMPAEELSFPCKVVRILFWLVQDCRNRVLNQRCEVCAEDRVPLARIWLYAPDDGRCCSVLSISSHPPYRREFGRERWPALVGQVNLGQIIWQLRNDADQLLVENGYTNQRRYEELVLPTTVAGLQKLFNERQSSRLCFELSSPALAMQTLPTDSGAGDRVVGFLGKADDAGGKMALAVEIIRTPEGAVQSETELDFTYKVTKTGVETVDLWDQKLVWKEQESPHEIVKNLTDDEYEKKADLPRLPNGPWQSRVIAVGRSQDGREICAEERYKIEIDKRPPSNGDQPPGDQPPVDQPTGDQATVDQSATDH